jgi:hypothetical protein
MAKDGRMPEALELVYPRIEHEALRLDKLTESRGGSYLNGGSVKFLANLGSTA